MAREGAKHLYLLDYSQQVEAFSKTLSQEYPETKVRTILDLGAGANAELTGRLLPSSLMPLPPRL
jgi:hypothetical protein